MQLMLQATVCDCLALDPFAFEEDGLKALDEHPEGNQCKIRSSNI
jgi:hypothetical protein